MRRQGARHKEATATTLAFLLLLLFDVETSYCTSSTLGGSDASLDLAEWEKWEKGPNVTDKRRDGVSVIVIFLHSTLRTGIGDVARTHELYFILLLSYDMLTDSETSQVPFVCVFAWESF